MSEQDTAFANLSKSEQLAQRQAEQWTGPYRHVAAQAEAALLLHRLKRSVEVISSREPAPSLPPFSGLGAVLLTAPAGTSALSHADGIDADVLGTDGIGTQHMRALNVNLRPGLPGADDRALSDWQRSRHGILSRAAPWTVVTSPKSRLISDTPHPTAPQTSDERLIPHSTAWSQTLYLAVRQRQKATYQWIGKNHPEWLDQNGNIAPYSILHSDDELTPVEISERERRLAELAFLRDLADLGVLYLHHIERDTAFFQFKHVGEHYNHMPKNGDEWNRASVGQALRWQRVNGRSENLTYAAGSYDPKHATAKAQCLCFMAAYAGFPVEEAIYQDWSDGHQENREAVFINTRWMTQERLAMIEQLISQYQAYHLSEDFEDYARELRAQGVAPETALRRAQEEFETPALNGIERTMGILEALAEHHLKQISIDIGDAYISLLDLEKDDPRAPIKSPLGIQRFGLSVDPSKINEQVLTEIGSTLSLNRPWVLRRGFQPRSLQVMNQVIRDHGSLGVNLPGQPLFPAGATLRTKANETDYLIRTLSDQVKSTRTLDKRGEADWQKQVEEANLRIDKLRHALAEMQQTVSKYQSRSADLEHALALSEDLYIATNIHVLELTAEADNVKLPPIKEPSRSAQWMQAKGYPVPAHQLYIQGRPAQRSESTISLEDAYKMTDQMELSERQAIFDRFGMPADDESSLPGPSII